MHRPNCSKVRGEELQTHHAGGILERNVAPKECWRCEPGVEMVLTL
jgi:hypothetical protein